MAMRLLDRYLLRELLVPFAYCLGGFLIFWTAFDVLDELSTLQRLQLKLPEVLEYYLVKTPEFLVTVVPIALLLALLYTLTNLARHNEVTAIRAAGVSLFRIALPYLAVGLGLSTGIFAVNEFWVPQSHERAQEIRDRHLANRPSAAKKEWAQNLGFVSGGGARNWWIQSFHLRTFDMFGALVVWTPADGQPHVLNAERARWLTNTWVFTNVNVKIKPEGADERTVALHYQSLVVPEFTETPDQIKSEIKMNRLENMKEVIKAQFSIREILDYQRLHPDGTSKQKKLDTMLHGRMATPWTCLVVVLIALPFGAASGRRNVFAGVASSILICFVYFVLSHTALALGSYGYVKGWVAAWCPNVLFGLAGIILTRRVR
ncbi:MAG: lipopolysaccharide export system permease protein [Verrucomicrobiota bacterium]|jgi:LPS export ABC transporter permease LptG